MQFPVKQAIVIRKDLGMRRGKEIAQGSHASMAFLVRRLNAAAASGGPEPAAAGEGLLESLFTPAEVRWMRGGMAKICLQVSSAEAELIALHDKARAAGLSAELIRDSGKTEFGGVPTLTCLAIGPDEADKVDAVTGDLKLY
jgi:peptidyl-tRNA hydrolase, PTH2 family